MLEGILGLMVFVVPYAIAALITARKLVYETMVRNETQTFAGVELGPRVYSRREYQELVHRRRSKTGGVYIGDLEGFPSDYTRIIASSVFWWVYWSGKLLRVALHGGHKKTPGQLEEENRTFRAEIKRLEKELGIGTQER